MPQPNNNLNTNLLQYIDDKFYETLNKIIKSEVASCVKSQLTNYNLLSETEPTNYKTHANKDNDCLITALRREVDFLKKEMSSKDKIIEMLLSDKQQCLNRENNANDVNTLNMSKSIPTENAANITRENIMNISARHDKNNNKRKKRTTVILGDSILNVIEQHKFKEGLGNNERVYVKSFSGANIEAMKSHVVPSKKYENDLVILHCGTNDLRGNETAENIAMNIIELAKEMKSDKNDVMVSGIVPRNDNFNEKGIDVNNFLTTLCKNCKFNFIDNSNINKVTHLNTNGLHLNIKGQYVLGRNLLHSIKL